jgi:hypothetical protein
MGLCFLFLFTLKSKKFSLFNMKQSTHRSEGDLGL